MSNKFSGENRTIEFQAGTWYNNFKIFSKGPMALPDNLQKEEYLLWN